MRRMSRNLQIDVAALASCLLFGSLPTSARDCQNVRTVARFSAPESFRADLDTVWQLVRDHFYDLKFNGVNWKSVGETYRAKLPDIKSKYEFQGLVNRMLGELHSSHTTYVTDDDLEYYMLPAVLHQDLSGHRVEHIGAMGSQTGSEFIVAGVLEGSPAEKAGILSGDRLVAADGQPFRAAGSFRGKEGKSVQLQFRRGSDSALLTTSAIPVKQNILRAFLEATERSAHIVTVSGKRLGYVHLWTMANDAFRTALDTLVRRRLHDTDGLVLDLRDGYGGSPWSYADVFYRPDVAWEQRSRGVGAVTRYSGYAKPIVVLINQGTRSAKELFCYELKSSHRAILVGSRTAGAFLGAGGFEVGGSGYLELAVTGLKVDGKLLEDNGVVPDVIVAPRFTYTDRDSQLLAAREALIEAIRSRSVSEPPARQAL